MYNGKFTHETNQKTRVHIFIDTFFSLICEPAQTPPHEHEDSSRIPNYKTHDQFFRNVEIYVDFEKYNHYYVYMQMIIITVWWFK